MRWYWICALGDVAVQVYGNHLHNPFYSWFLELPTSAFKNPDAMKTYFLSAMILGLFDGQISALCSPMLCKAPNTSWGSSVDASTIWGSSSRSTWAGRRHWQKLASRWIGQGKQYTYIGRESKFYIKLSPKRNMFVEFEAEGLVASTWCCMVAAAAHLLPAITVGNPSQCFGYGSHEIHRQQVAEPHHG